MQDVAYSADRERASGSVARAWALPHLAENVLSTLKECVEFIDDDPAEAIIQLIRHLQIQRSHLTDYISRFQLNDGVNPLITNIDRTHIDQAMFDAAEIHARTSTLFPFSRGHPADSFSVTRNRVREALWLARRFRNDDEIDVLADKMAARVFGTRRTGKAASLNLSNLSADVERDPIRTRAAKGHRRAQF
jgi:hypothetical protein